MTFLKQTAMAVLIFCLLPGCSEVGNNPELEGPPEPSMETWLDENPTVKASIKLENDASPSYWYGGVLSETEYDSWSDSDKETLQLAFSRAWLGLYYYNDQLLLGTEDYAMPLSCTYCETRLESVPTYGPFTVIPETLSKQAYIAHVAQSLAIEMGGGVEWSIAEETESSLHHYFNSRAMMHRLGGTSEFFFASPGGGGDAREKYLGRSTPATPIYTYTWLKTNNILKATHEETIVALLQWLRENGVHFYGSATYATMQEHWGYPSAPSVYHILNGTVRDTESVTQHWTAGCHGTAGFMKAVLKTINIPMEVIYTCGHAQFYFPSIDKYVDHGDNPYNATVRDQPEKNVSGLFLDASTYTARFGAAPDNIPNADPKCDNIGKGAEDF